MAKKKVDEKTVEVREDHEKLKKALVDVQAKRATVMRFLDHPDIKPVMTRFEKSVEEMKEKLVSADKKEIDGLQARVMACRALLFELRAAYEDDVKERQDELREFELQNALLINGEKVDVETGEVQTATA